MTDSGGFIPTRRPITVPRPPRRRALVRNLTRSGINADVTRAVCMRLDDADLERAQRLSDHIGAELSGMGKIARLGKVANRTVAVRIALKEACEGRGIYVPDGFNRENPEKDPVMVVSVVADNNQEEK